MGMYTELSFSARLRKDTPKEVIDNLRFLTGNVEDRGDIPTPDHPFFQTERTWLLRGDSCYFPGSMPPVFEKSDYDDSWLLITRSNVKNYSDEIEKFLEWIKPYIYQGVGGRDLYASVCYEEQDEPTLYYLR